ncbi:MAG: FAD-dependent oxidoreductase [bacterium]|jgi:2,4-dienoyl-CoA reductase-like NADH-dependent reductase (Old Yellow Enzyme family)/thioredoxin reductase|nr:FAD-dependent oxidoreductase [bacterium]MDD3805583.1 FAD-dependent oxidoreductase [bacterium]MDD4153026.1 FAD-dependent oxidoreductase [bacterium]MDD4557907.1 FAD-dependent oxidoreductase [bacterium]
MESFVNLFSTGRIKQMEIKNRVFMAPMVRNYADAQGFITPRYTAHIRSIASGGVGAMILEASFVSDEGKGFANELGIHRDECLPGLRDLVEAAHRYGAVIGPQLYHAGRQTASAISGMQPVAPSAIPDPTINEVPRVLEMDEIHRIVEAYAQGAGRAREAGCDFVEIHGAHGYLITQFLSPFSNRREDDYGGTPGKRIRFLEEVYRAVRQAVGNDYPVIVRLSGDEMVPGGLGLEDCIAIAQRLEEWGADALHVSAGNYASYELGYMISPMAIEDGPLVPLAQHIKGRVNIPVITVGKIRHPELAEEILSTGKADFIALGRPFLADPEWPSKAKAGRTEEINRCIACNQGCITRLFAQQDVWCTVNPQTGREEIFATPLPVIKQKVLVAGGGPAGMSAAKVLAERGHQVVLCEELKDLGGQLIAAAIPPYRSGWELLRSYLVGEMARLGIDVRLNTKATADMAQQEGFDSAIVAVGAHPVRLNIPGIQHANVAVGRDVLEGHSQAKGKVVVAGGGCAGAQTAEYLAVLGHEVSIVEMLGEIAQDAPRAERELLLGRLQKMGVKLMNNTKIMSIGENKVSIESPAGLAELPADTVVICLGSAPNDGIADALQKVVSHTVKTGDAVRPRKVTEAIEEGALEALKI